MEFGIAMPTDAESWRLAERAEALGFLNSRFSGQPAGGCGR